ncbi:MAG TPA: hypothetical protein VLF91_05495 [Candidatus Saccharimonadales bacterium]|nr:hypothetical protein [Candidatus Saccharimonadales bacterium]
MSHAAEQLLSICTPGSGQEYYSGIASDVPGVRAANEAFGSLASDQALLTPSTALEHPLTTSIEPETAYRGSLDFRSFSLATDGIPGAASVTVKGGDLPLVHHLPGDTPVPTVSRALSGQIPGGALLPAARHEAAMAEQIQDIAWQQLGRLTFTILPVRVNTITAVQNEAGQQVPLLDYLNSADYLTPPDWLMREFNLPGMALGDILLRHLQVQPAEYIYATPGLNIRVGDLVGARYFRAYDSPSERASHNVDDLLADDSLAYMQEGLPVWGDLIPRAPGRKDAVFRRIYSLLADTYNFDANDVLPSVPITDANYLSELQRIPERCAQHGVAELVLHGVVQRMTEVMALLHAQERGFSRHDGVGSSLMARNVTYNGVVLDLDTAGEFARTPEEHIDQDYGEALLTVASLRRIVAPQPRGDITGYMRQLYLRKLDQFGASTNWRRRVVNVLDTSQYIARVDALL